MEVSEVVCKFNVDSGLRDPSLKGTTAPVGFNEKNS